MSNFQLHCTSFCINCGFQGHTSNDCKLAIISLGLIIFRLNKNGEKEYLMIRRKSSFGFSDFLHSRFPIHNTIILNNIINEMTDSEKSIILQRIENIQSSQDDALGKRVKQYIENKVDLKQLIKNSVTSWTECEWGFPKGRRNAREKDFDCAIREFEEETGYKQTNIQLIENVVPYEEVFVGSNYKTYKHKYYIARANYVLTEDETLFQKSEVSKLQWKSYDECLLCIRPYNIEKKKMLFNVNKCITHFKLK